ncbi:hypothetical protein LCGC14_2844260 [marine sediment metagenome]|uniref:SCP domain-containing protein n=1 Tax=marine sediment metagenome TaxID=412755 RepID=A0A0F8YAG7_9ZZZZ
MTLLTTLLLLLGMTSTSFVSGEGTGYVVYMDSERLGWYEIQSQAEQAYNLALPIEDARLHEASCVRVWEMARNWSMAHLRPSGDRWWMGLELTSGTYSEIAAIHALTLEVAIDAWLGSPDHAPVLEATMSAYGMCYEPVNNTWVVIVRR